MASFSICLIPLKTNKMNAWKRGSFSKSSLIFIHFHVKLRGWTQFWNSPLRGYIAPSFILWLWFFTKRKNIICFNHVLCPPFNFLQTFLFCYLVNLVSIRVHLPQISAADVWLAVTSRHQRSCVVSSESWRLSRTTSASAPRQRSVGLTTGNKGQLSVTCRFKKSLCCFLQLPSHQF